MHRSEGLEKHEGPSTRSTSLRDSVASPDPAAGHGGVELAQDAPKENERVTRNGGHIERKDSTYDQVVVAHVDDRVHGTVKPSKSASYPGRGMPAGDERNLGEPVAGLTRKGTTHLVLSVIEHADREVFGSSDPVEGHGARIREEAH